ncbi:hypothetical protein [Noviherbaspirillum sp.]|uniref:hypothetical protein n=1 Tax=Noviherbaspirillum sp. TaxID=1926288 RepID=UPI002B496021|nr:hypothetical protein [Noviherbaspirillum sp.]HJV81837.1 hypothetical protein [Noviherbaspirillum sp.]
MFSSVSRSMAHLAFFALFPGFFFYHSALGTEMIGPMLGGYFSWVALAFAPFLFGLYLIEVMKDLRYLPRFDIFFFLYLLYFLLVVAFNAAGGADQDVVKDHLLAILQFVVVFIVFKMADFRASIVRWAAFVTLIVMTALVFYLSVDGMFYLKQDSALGDTESLASYQGFARSYFLTALAVAAFTNSIPLRMLIYALCIPALFMNGARSELIALTITVFLIEVFYARYRWLILVFAGVVIALCTLYFDELIAVLPSNRTLEILHLSADSSWQARNSLLLHGLRTIADHPLLGDYGSYVALGGSGDYIHNIFSAWVDLGLSGFLFLAGLLLVPMYRVCADMAMQDRKARSDEFVLSFALLFVTILLLLTAKNFTDVLIAAALGRYSHYCCSRSSWHGHPSSARPQLDIMPLSA